MAFSIANAIAGALRDDNTEALRKVMAVFENRLARHATTPPKVRLVEAKSSETYLLFEFIYDSRTSWVCATSTFAGDARVQVSRDDIDKYDVECALRMQCSPGEFFG